MLEVKGVSVAYNGKLVLKDINFRLEKGDFLAILGANGAGKSTLIKLLSGVVKPLSGSACFEGVDLLSLPPRERAKIVAVVPQEVNFIFPFSVEEVVAMGRYPYGGRGRKEVEWAITKLALEDLRNRSLSSLSGGEFKRVIIAKALAQTPKILLLDEPISHLDLKYQALLFKLLRELLDRGLIIISVFHELNIAFQGINKIMFLKDGEMLSFGSLHENLTLNILRKTFDVDIVKCESCGNIYLKNE